MGKSSGGSAARSQAHLQDVNRWRAWADARKDEAINIANAQLEACRRCRECKHEVALTEKICPHCGVSDPVRVPMTLPTILGIAAVIVLCGMIWAL